MGFFDKKEEIQEPIKNESTNYTPLFIAAGAIIFLPAIIVAYFYYLLLFRLLKYKPSFSYLTILSIFTLILIPSLFLNEFSFQNILPSYIIIGVLIGHLVGIVLIFNKARFLRKNPGLTALSGAWHGFKYKKTPLEKMQKKKIKKQLKNGELHSIDKAPIGLLDAPVILDNNVEFDKERAVYRYYEEGNKATLIFGAPGSGKTISLLNLILNDIEAGLPLCVINFKRGSDFAYHLSRWAEEYNREFYHFTGVPKGGYTNPYNESGPSTYDPLISGDSSAKATMMLNTRSWDGASEVYKTRMDTLLQTIFKLVEFAEVNFKDKAGFIPWNKGGLTIFEEALKIPNIISLVELFREYVDELRDKNVDVTSEVISLRMFNEVITDLESKNSLYREQIFGIEGTIKKLFMSSHSDWLQNNNYSKSIDLFKIATSNKAPIVLFEFNSLEDKDTARFLGSMILSDLGRVSGEKNKFNNDFFALYIDEFQVLPPDLIEELVAKVRSAGFITTLASQSPDQIVDSANEAKLRALLNNVNNYIIHAGSTMETSNQLAEIVGQSNKETYSASGLNTTTLTLNVDEDSYRKTVDKDFIIDPNEFMRLSSPTKSNNYKSTAYFITKQTSDPEFISNSSTVARKIEVVVDEEVLKPIPKEFSDNLYSKPSRRDITTVPSFELNTTKEEIEQIEKSTESKKEISDDKNTVSKERKQRTPLKRKPVNDMRNTTKPKPVQNIPNKILKDDFLEEEYEDISAFGDNNFEITEITSDDILNRF